MNHIPLVDLKAEYKHIKRDIDTAIGRVIENTSFILGAEVDRFEENFARYCQAKYCVGVASGTAALSLSLLALGIQPGDEVITTPFTFIATAEAISHCGAIPVFVDIDPNTYLINPDQIEAKITQKTRAIVPVHLYGQPADLDPIQRIAKRYGLAVVEDAAQAHGAEYKGKRVGTIGDVSCFSFYPGKNLGAYGDAGAVVTNDSQIAEKILMLRNHGRKKGVKYEHQIVGFGERIDSLHAAILNAKLPYLEEWTERRRTLAHRYNDLLKDDDFILFEETLNTRHVYHLYVLRHPKRDAILAFLKDNGIGAGVHYPIPLHLQPAYSFLGHRLGDFPQAERIAKEVFSLPLFPFMTEEQQDFIVSTVRQAVSVL